MMPGMPMGMAPHMSINSVMPPGGLNRGQSIISHVSQSTLPPRGGLERNNSILSRPPDAPQMPYSGMPTYPGGNSSLMRNDSIN